MDSFLEALLTAILEPLLGSLIGMVQGVLEAFLEGLLTMILEPVFHCLAHGSANVLLYGIAVPFSCVLCTPIVLARALPGSGRYVEKVFSGYAAICEGVTHPGGWWL